MLEWKREGVRGRRCGVDGYVVEVGRLMERRSRKRKGEQGKE